MKKVNKLIALVLSVFIISCNTNKTSKDVKTLDYNKECAKAINLKDTANSIDVDFDCIENIIWCNIDGEPYMYVEYMDVDCFDVDNMPDYVFDDDSNKVIRCWVSPEETDDIVNDVFKYCHDQHYNDWIVIDGHNCYKFTRKKV